MKDNNGALAQSSASQRPSWDDYFLAVAEAISRRASDLFRAFLATLAPLRALSADTEGEGE